MKAIDWRGIERDMRLPAVIGRRGAIMTALASFAPAAPLTTPIKVEVEDGRCVAPVILDGRLAPMVIDTGAERSLITRAAAVRLGLTFDLWVDTTLRDAGGRLETHRNADVSAAALGGLPLYQFPPTRSLSLSVTTNNLGGADGLLGSDVLRHFTLGLDVPNASFTLSPARFGVPSPGGINLEPLWPDLLLVPVVLDGQHLTALVDTGSSASWINARGLSRLGLTPAQRAQGKTVSLAGVNGRLPAHLYRFTNFRIGKLTITNPEILTASIPEAGFDMILGMDFLGRQRFCLSYTRKTLTFNSA